MESGNKSESTDESDTEVEQESNHVNWDRVWPGTREKARRRSIGHAKEEGGKYKARGAGRRGKEQAGTRPGPGRTSTSRPSPRTTSRPRTSLRPSTRTVRCRAEEWGWTTR